MVRFHHSGTNEKGLRHRKPLNDWRAEPDESGHWRESVLID